MPCSKNCAIPVNRLLSLATFPVLTLLYAADKLGAEVIEWGKLSEEVFRGDRLPLLDFPQPPNTDNP